MNKSRVTIKNRDLQTNQSEILELRSTITKMKNKCELEDHIWHYLVYGTGHYLVYEMVVSSLYIDIIQSTEYKRMKKKMNRTWGSYDISWSLTTYTLWEYQKEKIEQNNEKEYLNT